MKKEMYIKKFLITSLGIALFGGMLPTCSLNTAYAAGTSQYEPITLNKSSLNADSIYGKNDTTSSLDGNAFYSSGYNSADGYLPANGDIKVGSVPYKLSWTGKSDYDGKDSIVLKDGTLSQTMNLSTLGSYSKIYVLGTAGGPGDGNYANFGVKITYTDNSKSETDYRLYDWYDDTQQAGVTLYPKIRRINTSRILDAGSSISAGPFLQSASISVNPSKVVKSITFTLKGLNGNSDVTGLSCGIYAVTGEISGDAPVAPVSKTATSISDNAFTAVWNPVEGATEYKIDVSTTKDFSESVLANVSVGTATSKTITDLKENTTYYYRVRAVKDGFSSASSNIITAATTKKSSINNKIETTKKPATDVENKEPATNVVSKKPATNDISKKTATDVVSKESPKTGDTANIILFVLLILVSGTALVTGFVYNKKRA